MDQAEERRVLERLSEPITRDLKLRDPTATIDWVVKDGDWSYFVFDNMTFFEAVGLVEEPQRELDRHHAILSIAVQITDNHWPDEWVDPWPVCPEHPGHPLSPEMCHGIASWTCSIDGTVCIAIGSLATETGAGPVVRDRHRRGG